jgi:hypothetical protein
MPNVAPAATFTVTLRFTYKKSEPVLAPTGPPANCSPATCSPIKKLCISYRIPSEPNTNKFCNLVGQSATTNNPNACD